VTLRYVPAAPSPGETVRLLRKARGLSQDQLGAELGTSRQRVIAWEKEKNSISEEYAEKLAAWSGRPIGVFRVMNGDGPPSAVRRLERAVRELREQLADAQERLAAVERRQDPHEPD
jgi:transcriptional regulator with XRE-family HTH domain